LVPFQAIQPAQAGFSLSENSEGDINEPNRAALDRLFAPLGTFTGVCLGRQYLLLLSDLLTIPDFTRHLCAAVPAAGCELLEKVCPLHV
jgi:hypothetical protein